METVVSVIVGPWVAIAVTGAAVFAGLAAVALLLCALSYVGSAIVWGVGIGRGAR